MIVENYLLGYGRNENHVKVKRFRKNLSSGSVSNVIDEFNDSISDIGLPKTAEVYNVSQIAEELREMGEFSHKNKVSFPEVLEGARIAAKMKQMNAEPSELSPFITDVYQRAKDEGYDIKTLIKQCRYIASLEDRTGKKFDELSRSYKELEEEVQGLQNKREQLAKQSKMLQDEVTSLHRAHDIDKARLDDYSAVRRELQSLGLDISQISNYRNFLVNAKKFKFEAKKAINGLNRERDLESKLKELGDSVRKHREDLQQILVQIDEGKAELKSEQPALEEARKLRDSGLTIDQIQKTRNVVTRVAATHGITTKAAFNLFEEDILNNYDKILGLEPEVKRLEAQKENTEKDIIRMNRDWERAKKQHEADTKVLESQYQARKAEISAYSSARSKGVDDSSILRWNGILISTNLTSAVLESELRKFASFKRLEDMENERITKLQGEEKALASRVQSLAAKKEETENAIKEVKEKALTSIQELSNGLAAQIKENFSAADSKIAETAALAVTKIDESSKKATKKITELPQNLNNTLSVWHRELGLKKK